MATVDTLRNDLIDKLLSVSNKEFLKALNKLVENSNIQGEPVKLTEEQILMLRFSDRNIKSGQLIPHDEVTENDLKWPRGYQTTK